MARPDAQEIGGLKKGKKEKVRHKSRDGEASYMENRRTKKNKEKKQNKQKKNSKKEKKSIELSAIFFHQFYYHFSRPYTTWPEWQLDIMAGKTILNQGAN